MNLYNVNFESITTLSSFKRRKKKRTTFFSHTHDAAKNKFNFYHYLFLNPSKEYKWIGILELCETSWEALGK